MVGSLLLAHPDLIDPNFARSVILLTAHSHDDGALGVVLNRPLSRKLLDLKPELQGSVLAEIPLFRGGPVSSDQAILAAWKYEAEQAAFKLYFGIDENIIEFTLEDNELKHEKYIPGTGIKIISPASSDNNFDNVLVLAWNFFDQIKESYKSKFPKSKFIKLK